MRLVDEAAERTGLNQRLAAVGERAAWGATVAGALGLVAVAALAAPVLPAALAGPLAASVTAAYAGALFLLHQRLARRHERSRLDVGSYIARQTHAGRRVAIYDAATALYHRWYFDLRLTEEIERCRRHGLSMAVIVITSSGRDGIERANRVRLAQLIGHMVRSIDIPAGLDGLEYAVCLPHTDAAGAGAVLTRLAEGLRPYQLTLGLALYPQHGVEAEELLERAREEVRNDARPHPGPVVTPRRRDYDDLVKSAGNDVPSEIRIEAGESVRSIKSALRRASGRAGCSLDIWEDAGTVFYKHTPSAGTAA